MPMVKQIAGDRIVLYNLYEAADVLGVSERTLRNYIYKEIIPACKLKKNWYFTDRNLSAFLRGAKSIRRKKAVPAPTYEQ